MSNSRSRWRRVARARVCPICHKPDWCLVAVDDSAVICSRVESSRPAGRAGWLHQLRADDWQRSTWREVKRCPAASRPSVDMLEIAKRCCRSIRPTSTAWLANELGLSTASLGQLRVGWSEDRKAFSFPMREPNGNVCGVRYRAYSGAKFAETGSREGLFFCPPKIIRDYLLIVEGASDAAATIDLGFSSVVGRANCRGNVDQIESLCRRINPQLVVLIPDSDFVGIQGANQLRLRIERQSISVKTLVLPDEIKDARACVQQKENADWLADQIGKVTEKSPKHEATSNDDSK